MKTVQLPQDEAKIAAELRAKATECERMARRYRRLAGELEAPYKSAGRPRKPVKTELGAAFERSGMTYKQAANALGCDASYIGKILRAEERSETIERLILQLVNGGHS